jgi:hypothetical protein
MAGAGGDIAVQVETSLNTWTDVAVIKDTGSNLSAGSDVLQLMLGHSQVQPITV